MTIQAAPFGPTLLMLVTVAVLLALGLTAVVQLVRGRARAAGRFGTAAGTIVAVYVGALFGFGLLSHPAELPMGAAKCFDDWCATAIRTSTEAADGSLLVDVRLENRGRGRAMRSNLANAFVRLGDGTVLRPRNGDVLQALVQPGQGTDVQLRFDPGASTPGAWLVIAEGTGLGPGSITIDDEDSPYHARAGWPLGR
jgi:hypothetical protein